VQAKAHKLFGSSPHRPDMNGTEGKAGELEMEDEGIHQEDEEDEIAYKGTVITSVGSRNGSVGDLWYFGADLDPDPYLWLMDPDPDPTPDPTPFFSDFKVEKKFLELTHRYILFLSAKIDVIKRKNPKKSPL
jgi:hypothetical protein